MGGAFLGRNELLHLVTEEYYSHLVIVLYCGKASTAANSAVRSLLVISMEPKSLEPETSMSNITVISRSSSKIFTKDG